MTIHNSVAMTESQSKRLREPTMDKPLQLGKLTTNAIALYAGKLSKLDDKALRVQMLATNERLARFAAMTFNEGVMLGLLCKEAYHRWGRSGGYQKFLDHVGVSQSKASRWQRIADAFASGQLPAEPPRELDEPEWTQTLALDHINNPQPPNGEEGDVSPRVLARRRANGAAEDLLKKATKLINEIEKQSQEGSPGDVASVVGFLLQQSRRLNRDISEAEDAQIVAQRSEE